MNWVSGALVAGWTLVALWMLRDRRRPPTWGRAMAALRRTHERTTR